VAQAGENCVAPVVGFLLTQVMASVQPDDQRCPDAVEIHDESGYDVLPAKMKPTEGIPAQLAPEDLLLWRCITSQSSR
jgi:hypothetical protein